MNQQEYKDSYPNQGFSPQNSNIHQNYTQIQQGIDPTANLGQTEFENQQVGGQIPISHSFPQPSQPLSMPGVPVNYQIPQAPHYHKFSLATGHTNHPDAGKKSSHKTDGSNEEELPRRKNEVLSHYYHRKMVYDNVYAALKDKEKALCYSNIWYNMTYLGNKYSPHLEEIVSKYAPKNFVPPQLPEDFSHQYGYNQPSYEK